jgi:hypothetical protein
MEYHDEFEPHLKELRRLPGQISEQMASSRETSQPLQLYSLPPVNVILGRDGSWEGICETWKNVRVDIGFICEHKLDLTTPSTTNKVKEWELSA